MDSAAIDVQLMQRALQLAALGRGLVEPNPMVGCVIAQGQRVVGEGWHHAYGGPHAEVFALTSAGEAARGATLYVTLEPCCHHGKTPPCTDAVLRSGVKRVVIAAQDPFPDVAGKGMQRLREAGLQVEVGLLQHESRWLNAPFERLVRHGRPWIMAKWAMTLDGKIATHTGQSRWISSPESRQLVHHLRGRVDAVLVGSGTALADDPQLTARPAGPRTATRVVFDSLARTPLESQLVRTARDIPVTLVVGPDAEAAQVDRLRQQGCEVLVCAGQSHAERLAQMLRDFGRRRWTNVLVEGGAGLMGLLWDQQVIDEVHVFVAPTIWGGDAALSPIGGRGVDLPELGGRLRGVEHQTVGTDVYFSGRITTPVVTGKACES